MKYFQVLKYFQSHLVYAASSDGRPHSGCRVVLPVISVPAENIRYLLLAGPASVWQVLESKETRPDMPSGLTPKGSLTVCPRATQYVNSVGQNLRSFHRQ